MWWGLLTLILAVSVVVMVRFGPVAALGCGVLLSFLFPVWITEGFMGVSIDLRVGTALILLLANLFHPRRRISWVFTAGDWAVFVLYIVHVASDSWQDGFALFLIPRAFGEWNLPYISGRLAIQNAQDWRWLTGIAAIVATVCGLWATTEAISRVNIGNPVFGARPEDRTPSTALRGGFKRAEGPTRNAIWFGMVQTLLLPWTIAAGIRGLRGDGPAWWCATPVLNLCGIAATISRGPALAAIGMIYLTAVFCLPKFRNYLIVAGVVIAVAGFLLKDSAMASLKKVEDLKWDSIQQPTEKVEFNGQQHEFNAISARWLTLYAYRPAIEQAGFLGFGTERTDTFPVNVPLGPDAKQTISAFWTIDCEYLLLILRFGWAGVTAFTIVCICSIWRILNQTGYVTPEEKIMPLAIAATLISATLALIVEWMPHDYGFMFLWLVGVANGIRPSWPTKHRQFSV
jgi:hypothetical protein